MAYVVQERQRGNGTWQTMELGGQECEMALPNAECAACKLRRHFGDEFEYRVVKGQKEEPS